MTEEQFNIKPEYKDKAIRSFVIRSGRITDGQRLAMQQQWPIYGLSLFDGAIDFETVFENSNPVVIEIGFGMGDSLLQMAKNEPDKNFIGIEVHPPGVGRIINEASLAGIKNIRIYCADANDVLDDCIASSSVERVQLYFPDPWHKKKHNKRRIVNEAFVARVHEALIPNGTLHMATDWEPYAEHMMEVLSDAEQFDNKAGKGIFSERPDYRPITKFERRGQGLGHGVWDLLFINKK